MTGKCCLEHRVSLFYNHTLQIYKNNNPKMSFCIYKSSEHYKQAKSNPIEIIQPIGYDSLHAQDNTSASKAPLPKYEKEHLNFSDLSKFTIRTVFEKSLLRTLSHYRSQRLTPDLLINQYLKISELQRKNQYLSGNVLQFIINSQETEAHIIADLEHRFFPTPSLTPSQKSLIEASQLLYNPPFEGIYHIGDYAVSKYFILFENSNEKRIDFISDAINRKLLGYDVQVLRIKHEKSEEEKMNEMRIEYRQREAPSNYAALRQILDKIDSINSEYKRQDPFYSGVHFYFGDYSFVNRRQSHRLLKRQIQHLPILQYYLLMLTGLLAHNQSAILKLQGSFQHKTVQFLYILNLIFDGKITLSKPLGSNPFTNDTYVLCQHYNKQMGKIIHRYLIVNFGLLYGEDGKGTAYLQEFLRSENQNVQENQQYLNSNIVFDRFPNLKRGEEYLHVREEKLLIDIKKLIKDDFQSISQFNDQLIYRGVQMNVANQKKCPNTIYFPNKTNIAEKLVERHCRDLSNIIDLIPEPTIDKNEKKQEDKKNADKTTKKQADFSMLTMLSQPRIQHKQEKAKSKHKKSHHHHHHHGRQKQRSRSRQKKKEEIESKKNPMQSFLQRIKEKNQEDKKAKGKSKSKKK